LPRKKKKEERSFNDLRRASEKKKRRFTRLEKRGEQGRAASRSKGGGKKGRAAAKKRSLAGRRSIRPPERKKEERKKIFGSAEMAYSKGLGPPGRRGKGKEEEIRGLPERGGKSTTKRGGRRERNCIIILRERRACRRERGVLPQRVGGNLCDWPKKGKKRGKSSCQEPPFLMNRMECRGQRGRKTDAHGPGSAYLHSDTERRWSALEPLKEEDRPFRAGGMLLLEDGNERGRGPGCHEEGRKAKRTFSLRRKDHFR